MSSEKVGYIYSPLLVEQLNKVDKISGRSEMVNSLINSYGLFSKLRVIAPQPCDRKQLQTFHSSSYLDYLADCVGPSGGGGSFVGDDDDEENLDASLYGLDHDCPIVEGLFDLCAQIGGASLTAADLLISGECKYVINWFGGWHHAKRERASGYCYVNDCVLAILRLRKRFERVLYIDLDLHHGDGVQEAFEYTNKVVTLSLHKHSPGFFPGTGGLNETGKGPSGAYHTINVPFLSGLDDTTLTSLFSPIFTKLVEVYRPQAIVLQCGADGLYGDPIDSADQAFNLTLDGYMSCVRHVIASQVPTMFLGGGGYNLANTARLWTSIVDLLVSGGNSLGLNNDIPDHDAFFLEYAPSYEMRIEPGCLRNKNTPDYVQGVLATVMTNLDNIKIE